MNLSGFWGSAKRGLANALANRPINSSTEVRLTRRCTQRCRQCNIYTKVTDPPTLSPEDFAVVAGRLREYGAYIGFVSGGEPTLVPGLEQILLEAKRTFPVAVTLNTGLYLKTEMIEPIARFVLGNNINIQTSLDGLGRIGDNLRGVPEFSKTVLGHMHLIARLKRELGSQSLLYANIVLNHLNLDQIPEMIHLAAERGWEVSVGLYHTLTASTREDEDLIPVPGPDLDRLIAHLLGHPRVLTLDRFLRGIKVYLQGDGFKKYCPYLASPVLSTRLLVMENGDVHLCRGGPIGNILRQGLKEIFRGPAYAQRLKEYRRCPGCWTSCYVQRLLLLHPRSLSEFLSNLRKAHRARRGVHLSRRTS
ncbi:MAG: radical SAM protein [bacterium]